MKIHYELCNTESMMGDTAHSCNDYNITVGSRGSLNGMTEHD